MTQENYLETIADVSFDCINDLISNEQRKKTFQILSLILDTRELGNWREPIVLARQRTPTKDVPQKLPQLDILLSSELIEACRTLMEQFDVLHGDRLNILMKDMTEKMKKCQEDFTDPQGDELEMDLNNNTHIDSLKNQFEQIFELLFKDKVNWGRILSLFGFLRAICSIVENRYRQNPHQNLSLTTEEEFNSDSGHSSQSFHVKPQLRAAHYIVWTADFIHGSKVHSWIEENGSWEGLIEFRNRSYDSELSFAFRTFEDILRKSSFVICSAILITLGALLCRYLKN